MSNKNKGGIDYSQHHIEIDLHNQKTKIMSNNVFISKKPRKYLTIKQWCKAHHWPGKEKDKDYIRLANFRYGGHLAREICALCGKDMGAHYGDASRPVCERPKD